MDKTKIYQVDQTLKQKEVKQDIIDTFNKDGDTRESDTWDLYDIASKKIDEYIKKENIQNKKLKNNTTLVSELQALKEDFDNKKEEYTWWNRLATRTNVDDLATKLAAEISGTEKEFLVQLNRELAEDSETQETEKQISEATDNTNKKYYTQEKDWFLKLTSATNKPRIDQVLNKLLDSNPYREIDYSECTNPKIKEKMSWLWTHWKCLITCPKDASWNYILDSQWHRTYLMCDEQWNPIKERALIWEGVRIKPSTVYVQQARVELQQQVEAKNKQRLINMIDKQLLTPLQTWWLLDKFLQTTEETLNKKVKQLKFLHAELEEDPIGEDNRSSNGDFMSIKYDFEWWDRTDTLFDKKMDDKLFDILDWNETPLKKYLNQRIQEIWNNYDDGLIRDIDAWAQDIVHSGESQEIKNQNQENILLNNCRKHGLTMFNDLFDTIRHKNFHANTEMWKIIKAQNAMKDAIYSIDQKKVPNITNLTKIIEEACNEMFLTFWDEEKGLIKAIIDPDTKWKTEQQVQESQTIALRKFWMYFSVFDNSYTAQNTRDQVMNSLFEWDQITEEGGNWATIKTEAQNWLKFKEANSEYAQAFKNIDNLLNDDILSDPSKTQQRQIVDSLYNCTSANAIFYTLQTTTPRIIPEKAEFDTFKDTCWKLLSKLQTQKEAFKKYEVQDNTDDIKTYFKDHILTLKAKEPKTDEDFKIINGMEYLLSDAWSEALQDYVKSYNETQLATLKYSWFTNMVKTTIGLSLIKEGWWLDESSGNKELIQQFNDSIGAWDRNPSDESREEIAERTGMIAEELAFLLVAMAVWAVTWWVWTAALYGIKGAKYAAKWLSVWKKMKTAVSYAWKYIKNAKLLKNTNNLNTIRKELWNLNKVWEIAKAEKWLDRAWFFIEWATFHATNTALNNLANGKKMFDGLSITEHPDEYLHSILVLWGLKWLGKLTQAWGKRIMKWGEKLTEKWIQGLLKKTITKAESSAVCKETISILLETEWLVYVDKLSQFGINNLRQLWDQEYGKDVQRWQTLEEFLHSFVMTLAMHGFMRISQKGEKSSKTSSSAESAPQSKELSQEAWEAQQNKYSKNFYTARARIKNRKRTELHSDAMRKLADANKISDLKAEDIKAIQAEIWAETDGIIGPQTVNQLKIYLNSEKYMALSRQAAQQRTEMNRKKAELDEIQSRINENNANYEQAQRIKELETKQKDLEVKQTDLKTKTEDLKKLQEQLQEQKKPKNIVNRETLSNALAGERNRTNNANDGSMTFDVNENYTWEIIQWKDNQAWYILLKPKNWGNNIRINRDPSAEYWKIINETGWKDVDGSQTRKDRLNQADSEIAEEIALALPDCAIEFAKDGRDSQLEKNEAEACKNGHSDQHLEIWTWKNGNIMVRKVSDAELTLNQQIKTKEQEIKTLSQEIDAANHTIQDLQGEQHQAIHHTAADKELQAKQQQAEADLATAKQQLEATQKAIDNLEIWIPEGPAERASAEAEADAAKKKAEAKAEQSKSEKPATPEEERKITSEERDELNKNIAEAKNKSQSEKEQVSNKAIDQGQKDVLNAEKEQEKNWNLSDKTKEGLKKTKENLENAEKLTKNPTLKERLYQLISRIKELLNRNRYGEFMKSLRSKEGLTINEAKYKIIEKEGKKFIQKTAENGKKIWDPMEMNYKNLDELHKEFINTQKIVKENEKLENFHKQIYNILLQPELSTEFNKFLTQLKEKTISYKDAKNTWDLLLKKDSAFLELTNRNQGQKVVRKTGFLQIKEYEVDIKEGKVSLRDWKWEILSWEKLIEEVMNGNILPIKAIESGKVINFDYEKYKNDYPELCSENGVTIWKATYKLILDENNVMKIERTRWSEKLLITEFDKDYIDRIKTYKEAFEKRASELQSQLLDATATKETYQSQLNSIRSQLSEIKQQIDWFSALQTQFDQKQTALQNFRRQQFTQAKGKKLRLNGDERHCEWMKENWTLQFKKYDNNENFTISSFADFSKNLIKINWERYQLSRISDRSTVQQKERKAWWRDISQYEQENINFWREAIQQEQTLLQDFNTAKQALSPLKGLQEQKTQLEDQYQKTEEELNRQNTLIKDINQILQNLNVDPKVLDAAA